MSNAQLLYLEMNIAKKLHRDINCISRLLSHKNLWLRLQPLAAEAHIEISTGGEALGQASKEARSWLEKGSGGKMENFEEEVSMRCNTDRLAILTLGNASDDSSPVSIPQLLEPDCGK
jgi:hypothetical protein